MRLTETFLGTRVEARGIHHHSVTRGAWCMRACLRCAAAAVPARRARRHLEPWHAARGAGRFAAARVSSGAMASSPRETNVSAAGVSAGGDSSRETRDASPSPRVQRAATPMRGLTGKHHPSVNLPPLRLPRCAEGEDGRSASGASGEDSVVLVGFSSPSGAAA